MLIKSSKVASLQDIAFQSSECESGRFAFHFLRTGNGYGEKNNRKPPPYYGIWNMLCVATHNRVWFVHHQTLYHLNCTQKRYKRRIYIATDKHLWCIRIFKHSNKSIQWSMPLSLHDTSMWVDHPIKAHTKECWNEQKKKILYLNQRTWNIWCTPESSSI